MNDIQSRGIVKYPRTPHLEGSRLQAGDDGSDQMPLAALKGKYVVIEEKIDGANSGFSFDAAGTLMLQSRGHYLVGGGSERQFNLLKPWTSAHSDALLDLLEDRWLCFGEWSYSKHSVYYDCLPHYFLEFDVLDKRTGQYEPDPFQWTPRSAMSVIHGRPVRSLATNREPAVGG